MVERFIYFSRRALRNMRQSPFLCAAAVGTMAVSLSLVAFFALVVLNVQKLTGHWSEEVQVVAYLDASAQPGFLKALQADVEGMPRVQGVSLVTPQEAFERFRKRLGADGTLLEGLENDFLPASLEISLQPEHRNQEGMAALVESLKQKPGLSDLRYGRDWLQRFESLVGLLKLFGAVFGGFLLFAALFIVSNTIKITLYAHRDELEVMALVGGTPLFIKTPFLLEAALQGLIGGLVALVVSYSLFQLFLREGMSALLMLPGSEGISFLPFAHQLFLVASGVLLGLCGSLLSLRKLVRL
ncbi:MAG: ABC transporter permease [Desulfuromonas sp.]|uniref:permease-like cell division protein FtsX n=1 Tax=Desulfuromonas sp. TaxID=892 RepID=UPI000CAAB55F|nr:permease-like cell division protein FtsX [Desulfuromonas sp.]PLX83106.1 MAG: ABC transporter permease [Desulfuromonas sp.]